MIHELNRYYSSSEFSDLIVHTSDQDFKVHRLVVCGQSGYFSRLDQGDWPEAVENETCLREDDLRAIEAMFQYTYGVEHDNSSSDQDRKSPMLLNVKVYQVANKYDVPQLKEHAKEKSQSIVEISWKMDNFPLAIEESIRAYHEGGQQSPRHSCEDFSNPDQGTRR
ncbi:BTB/POZ domain protein [Aspergillus saccharolyticus JOP 1030-1]|uniref:BTB/POZ domain protein n=1 Tax=Aspergillus saccharolyticus JOP 1030-1 TaxID=1450539 RepID=A0A318ZNH3_9EURO|nr:BTB/POZ domain protein [Aspergillus saccharolyticus JOP 1030-1]PYH45460.1 BTB/POZ domain protein [Aspergillus saccharolyticus JOP 1030-1]